VRPIRERLPDVALVVAAICISLALAEGFVRLFHPHVRDHVVPGRLFEIDEALGWKLRPGANAIHASRYFDAPYSINGFGYRDRVRSIAKEAGTHRVLLYGDSQAFGWGVPETERFSNLIETRSAGVEVWNLAVPGYGLDQEILSYERDGARFAADEVVLLVSVLTLSRLPHDYLYRKPKPKFVLDADGRLQLVPVAPGANAWTNVLYEALSHFYLPYFVDQQIAAARSAMLEPREGKDLARRVPAIGWGRLEQSLLERAHAAARSRGHRLTLLVHLPPTLETMKQGLRRYCDGNAIGFLEIELPPPAEQHVHGARDNHWNVRANALIADQLLAQLRVRAAAMPAARAAASR
jgi:hypothetical protein